MDLYKFTTYSGASLTTLATRPSHGNWSNGIPWNYCCQLFSQISELTFNAAHITPWVFVLGPSILLSKLNQPYYLCGQRFTFSWCCDGSCLVKQWHVTCMENKRTILWLAREGGRREVLSFSIKQLAKNALIGRILSKNVEPKIHPKSIAEISNFCLFLCFQMQKLLAKEIKFLLQQQILPQLPYIYSKLDIIVNVYSKRNKEKFHPMRNSALEHLKHFGKNSLMSC